MTWLRNLGPIQSFPITPVAAVSAEENLAKRPQEVEAVDEDREESEGEDKKKKIFKPKKAKGQDARLKELLERAASQHFLHLFYQARRPLKSRCFPKKNHEKEVSSFYREVRPLSAKRFVARASEAFHSLRQEKVVIKKKTVTKNTTPSLLPLALCFYVESVLQEASQEEASTPPTVPSKCTHSFFHRKSTPQNIEETLEQAKCVDVGQQKALSVLRKTQPLERHFWFCLNDALNKYAKAIDQKTKSRFVT